MPARRSFAVATLLPLLAALSAGCGRGGDPTAAWNEAKTAFEARDWDRMEASLDRVEELRPPTPEDWMLRAQLLMGRDRNGEAIETLGRVPDSYPLAATARLQAGQLLLRAGRTRAAEAELLRAAAMKPAEVQARRELVFLYGTQSRWRPLGEQFRAMAEVTALSMEDVTLWCLSRNMTWDPETVHADLSRFLAADPEDRMSRLALVDNLRRRQYLDEAEAALAPLPDADPDARAERAKLALDRGDAERAEALLKGGPAEHVELARLRAQFDQVRGDNAAALAQYRIAHRLDPDNRDTLFGLGSTLALIGKADEAAPYLKKTRDYDAIAPVIERLASMKRADDPRLFHTMGAAYEAVGRPDEARAWFRLAIARDPLDSEAQQALYRLKPTETAAGTR